MAKVIYKSRPGCITSFTLPSGVIVSLHDGENEIPDASYEELVKIGIIKEKTKSHKEQING